MNRFDGEQLSVSGLNLQAVFNLSELPTAIVEEIKNFTSSFEHYTQLILIAHGGSLLWQKLKVYIQDSSEKLTDPVDHYTCFKTTEFFSQRFSVNEFELLYPYQSKTSLWLPLQSLGEMAGWHNTSPFKLGINQEWGSWFAYRAVVLVKSRYLPTKKIEQQSPCVSCQSKICITSCPAAAITQRDLLLNQCLKYRLQPDSLCQNRCLARLACPVANQHRYSEEQLDYHYRLSLNTLKSMTLELDK